MWFRTDTRVGFARLLAAAMLALAAADASGAPADQAALEKQLAAANARLDAAAREVAELSGELYGDGAPGGVRMMRGRPPGAMLGINIGGPRELDDGVEIVGVSPGGPAEAAGLRAGDVIVAVNGAVLKRSDARSPASQLVTYMRGVEPGQVVRLQYLRDGKHATAEVKPTAAEPMFEARILDDMMPRGIRGGSSFPGFRAMTLPEPGFGSLELAPVTPGLGRYFGTDKGLLVVRAPREPGLGLMDGDVLMTVGGRAPESPGQAFRILQSYEPGDKVKLGILRDRKRMDVEATLPEASRMHGYALQEPVPLGPPRPLGPAMPTSPAGKADAN